MGKLVTSGLYHFLVVKNINSVGSELGHCPNTSIPQQIICWNPCCSASSPGPARALRNAVEDDSVLGPLAPTWKTQME